MLSKCTHNHEVAAMDMPWTTVLCWQLAWSFENKELRTEHYMIHCWTMLHRKRGWTNGMNDPSCWTESSHRTMKSTTGPQLDEKRWTNINVWCFTDVVWKWRCYTKILTIHLLLFIHTVMQMQKMHMFVHICILKRHYATIFSKNYINYAGWKSFWWFIDTFWVVWWLLRLPLALLGRETEHATCCHRSEFNPEVSQPKYPIAPRKCSQIVVSKLLYSRHTPKHGTG